MVNFDDFVGVMVGIVDAKMGSDVVITKQEVKKMGDSYTGISCKKKGGHISAVVDVRDMFNKYRNGGNPWTIADEVVERLKLGMENIPEINEEDCLKWEYAKDKVIMELVRVDENTALLIDVPHRYYGDMALIYRIDLGYGTAVINNKMMGAYGVDEDELFRVAMENSKPTLMNLAEAMGFGGDDDSPLWVGTVNGGLFGAVCILNEEFMQTVTERLGERLWVLPSSVHEVLFLEDNGVFGADELGMLVHTVNGTEVSPEDVLSDTVYHYDGGNWEYYNGGELKVAW